MTPPGIIQLQDFKPISNTIHQSFIEQALLVHELEDF